MSWIAQVCAYYQYPNLTRALAVDHRIGKVLQRVDSAQVVCRRPNSRKPHQQLGDTFELVEESVRELCSALAAIEARRFEEV